MSKAGKGRRGGRGGRRGRRGRGGEEKREIVGEGVCGCCGCDCFCFYVLCLFGFEVFEELWGRGEEVNKKGRGKWKEGRKKEGGETKCIRERKWCDSSFSFSLI